MTEDSNNRRPALISATLSAFFTPFMASSVNIALPTIGREFHMDAILLSWVASAYLLASAIFLLPFGRLGDILGRKRIFLWGVGLYIIVSLLFGFAATAPLLIVLRVVQGISVAMMFATSLPILVSVYPPKERGRAIGIVTAAVYLGLSLGPFFGGMLTQHFGWRSLFLVTVPLALMVLIYTLARLKGEWAEARGERMDFIGSAIYCMALVAVMYGFSLLPRMMGGVLIALGIVGVASFLWWETKPEHPLLDVRVFKRNIPFIFSNLAALINYSATFAVTFLLSLYLQYIKALTPQNAGLILVAQPAMMTIFSPMAGRLSDRLEPRYVASIGMALTAIGLAIFVFLTNVTSVLSIVLTLLILGLGFALFSSPNTNAVMASVDRRFYGIASAVQSTMRLVGQTFSMGLATLIFAVVIGRVQITPEYYPPFLHAVKIIFTVSATLCFIGVFISLARGRIHK